MLCHNEKGSVISIALLILVLLTMIGIFVSKSAIVAVTVSGNEKAQALAFYNAESSIMTSPKLISTAISTDANPTEKQNVKYAADDAVGNQFYREVMGFAEDPEPAGCAASLEPCSPDVTFIFGDPRVETTIHSAEVDIKRTGEESVGGGAEFGSGAEGAGTGTGASVSILYQLDAKGKGPGNNAASNIVAIYRKMPAAPGGL